MTNKKETRIGVVGSGSWATALVKILCENLKTVNWWVRNEYTQEYIYKQKQNPTYVTAIKFDPKKLNITTDINELVKNSEYIIFATPSIYLKDALSRLTLELKDKKIFSAIKGIIPDTNDVTGNYLHHQYQIPYENMGVITGPCHAEEIAFERLSYLTVASVQKEDAEILSKIMNSSYLKTTLSDDIFGTEYAAVLKNIYAIGCGIYHGLSYGDNFQAVFLTNCIREMNRFIQQIHPLERDINNSAYLGDLLVTGYSFFSRNRMLGNMIGKGYTVRSATLEMNMIAEGYYAAESIYNLSIKNKIEMPIVEAIYSILYKNAAPAVILRNLCDKLN